MKTKRKAALIISALLVIFMMISSQLSVFAAGSKSEISLLFTLSSEDGEQVLMADHDDVITVIFTMSRTDAEEGYSINGFQNYIHYDLDFFELVEGSVVCYDTGNAVAKKQNSITFGEIIQCQNMANTRFLNSVSSSLMLYLYVKYTSFTIARSTISYIEVLSQVPSASIFKPHS